MDQVKCFAPIGMLEFWNIGIMGSGLRLGEDNEVVALEKQTNIMTFQHQTAPPEEGKRRLK
jgi:hypothetical protein